MAFRNKIDNILLTGSGGFIGRYVNNALTKDYHILAPKSTELNLLDKTQVEKYLIKNNVDLIIHLACCGVRILPNDTNMNVAKPNIQMFNNLADSDIPMIVTGSGAEYDKSKPLKKVKEDEFGKSIPNDPYGYSKYIISKEIEKRDNILNLRLFGIYGAGEDKSRVTSCIINDYLAHRPIMLNQNVKYDFMYIDDFCNVLKFFIEHDTEEKFINVSPTHSIEILELADIVNTFSDHKSSIVFRNNGMNNEYTGDNTKLTSIMPKIKFTSYEDGMKKMYDVMKNVDIIKTCR